MKHKININLIANIFIILSSVGMLFSVAGIVGTWVVKPKLQKSMFSLVETFQQVLNTTEEGMTVLDGTLETTRTNFSTIQTTLDGLDITFENIVVSLDTSSTLVGDDLRQTVIDSKTALISSATTARIIDRTLSIIAAIPLIGADYQPEVPLHISLESVATSLGDIPDSLEEIEQSMKATSDGLTILQSNLRQLSEDLSGFDQDLRDTQLVLRDYSKTIQDVLKDLESFHKKIPLYILVFSIGLTGTLLSFGIAQACILLFGLAYRQGERQIIYINHPRQDEEKNHLEKEI